MSRRISAPAKFAKNIALGYLGKRLGFHAILTSASSAVLLMLMLMTALSDPQQSLE